ncbi:MAG: hypothetical protein JSW51_03835 [Gemmatimonadota bacterium]|nr:MAG: hypothetical protein JSW51_03835 [Gemmatimonadota bacterium]
MIIDSQARGREGRFRVEWEDSDVEHVWVYRFEGVHDLRPVLAQADF